MAKKHVIAFFMHETERNAASAALTSAEVTDSFVMGDIEESAIEALRKQGLIVQEQISRPGPTLEGTGPRASLPSGAARRGAAAPPLSFGSAVPSPTDFYT